MRRGQIGRLALVQIASPAAMAILAYPLALSVRGGHEGALLWGLAAAAGMAAVIAAILAAPLAPSCLAGCSTSRWYPSPRRWWDRESARGFLTVSGSMLTGGAAASLVLLTARARILHRQGFAVAGQFDAAWAISMNHVSLVLASLQTYCLPVLARTPDRAERSAHLTRMLTAAALAAAAVVCALAVLKPVVLAVFYSDALSGSLALSALDAGGGLSESLELGALDSDAGVGRYARVPGGGSERVRGFRGGRGGRGPRSGERPKERPSLLC